MSAPSVAPSENGSTNTQRRQPETWKRSMNAEKRSHSSRTQRPARYMPLSMRASESSRNRPKFGRQRFFLSG